MVDEQLTASGMSTDFGFTIVPATASSTSDAQDMMKSSAANLRADGPDVKASWQTGCPAPTLPANDANF